MKKSIKIIAVILSAITVVSLFGGCKKSKNNNEIKDVHNFVLDTVHGGKSDPTDDFVLKDGKTDYVIVVSQDAATNELRASGIIANYFFEAAGAQITSKKDDEITDSEKSRIISVGSTSVAESAGIDYTYDSESGFQIRTVGKSIYLTGGNSGIIYSAYELLKFWFNFEYYAEYCYSLDRNVTSVPLHDFDITEIPDFEYRTMYVSGAVRYTSDANYRDGLRLMAQSQEMVGFGSQWHNSFSYISGITNTDRQYEFIKNELKDTYTELYGSENHYEQWFSENKDGSGLPYQLCYSRYPDEFVPIVLENLKTAILANPNSDVFTFSGQDNTLWCTCESCTRAKEQYGTDSAMYLRFLNKLVAAMREWLEEEGIERSIKLSGLAYHGTVVPPTVYNESTGEYDLVSDDVALDPDVYMVYCPTVSSGMNYEYSFDDEVNAPVLGALRSWSSMTTRLIIYAYCTRYYGNYFVFTDRFGSMQRNYQYYVNYDAVYLLDLGQYNNRNATGFEILRLYLTSKLAWDCQADVADLTENFFNNYFGPAAEQMKTVLNAVRGRYYQMLSESEDNKLPSNTLTKDIFPKGFVLSLLSIIDDAYKAAKPLEATDTAQFEAINDRICLESLFLRYALITLYAQDYTQAKQREMCLEFKEDCTRLNVTHRSEHVSISELWKDWGVA